MDAPCLVGIQHLFGQIEYITIDWDGQGVGEVLHNHYQSREKVVELIRGGSRPYLDGPDDVMEEVGDSPKLVRTHQDFFQINTNSPQYYYLFTTDNSWVIYSIHLEPHVQAQPPSVQHENSLYD
jgi:hypothetical protein